MEHGLLGNHRFTRINSQGLNDLQPGSALQGGKGNIPTGLDGRGSGELPFSGYRVSRWEDRNVLEMTVLIKHTTM